MHITINSHQLKLGNMELLIAVLIAFGVVTGNEATSLTKAEAEQLITESNISKTEMDKQASIIGLEEADF